MRYYRGKLGIGILAQGEPRLEAQGLRQRGVSGKPYHFLKGIDPKRLKSLDGVEATSGFRFSACRIP